MNSALDIFEVQYSTNKRVSILILDIGYHKINKFNLHSYDVIIAKSCTFFNLLKVFQKIKKLCNLKHEIIIQKPNFVILSTIKLQIIEEKQILQTQFTSFKIHDQSFAIISSNKITQLDFKQILNNGIQQILVHNFENIILIGNFQNTKTKLQILGQFFNEKIEQHSIVAQINIKIHDYLKMQEVLLQSRTQLTQQLQTYLDDCSIEKDIFLANSKIYEASVHTLSINYLKELSITFETPLEYQQFIQINRVAYNSSLKYEIVVIINEQFVQRNQLLSFENFIIPIKLRLQVNIEKLEISCLSQREININLQLLPTLFGLNLQSLCKIQAQQFSLKPLLQLKDNIFSSAQQNFPLVINEILVEINPITLALNLDKFQLNLYLNLLKIVQFSGVLFQLQNNINNYDFNEVMKAIQSKNLTNTLNNVLGLLLIKLFNELKELGFEKVNNVFYKQASLALFSTDKYDLLVKGWLDCSLQTKLSWYV